MFSAIYAEACDGDTSSEVLLSGFTTTSKIPRDVFEFRPANDDTGGLEGIVFGRNHMAVSINQGSPAGTSASMPTINGDIPPDSSDGYNGASPRGYFDIATPPKKVPLTRARPANPCGGWRNGASIYMHA